MSVPNPASLTLLEDLGQFPVSSKVRFLGCVESYDLSSATLTITHKSLYGDNKQKECKTKMAKVDIANLVNTLDPCIIQDGEWVNIIGYVSDPPRDAQIATGLVYIEGVHLWSSGAVDLGGYERSLRDKLAMDKQSVHTSKMEP